MKTFKVASAAAILLISPFASAEANVKVSGIIDACVALSTGIDGAKAQLNSGCAYGSRLIFSGKEDLGGGLSANFSLESGFNIDTGALGQGGRLFGRRALVGLGSPYGELQAGRDYAPTFYLVRPIDPFKLGTGTASSMVSSAARSDGQARNDNAIVYTSPTVRGFALKAQYALGESTTAGASRGRDAKGVLVSYTAGGLYAGAAYNSSANATDTGNDKIATIGASYKTREFEPAFLYQVGKWEATRTLAVPSVATSVFSRDYASMLVGLTYQPGGTGGRWIGSFKRYNDKTARNFDAGQLTLGYKYSLSKQTELYLAHSRVINKNGAAYAVVDAINTYGAVEAGANPATLFAGITLRF